MVDKSPRQYAEQIGLRMREFLREQVKDVPENYRAMVIDHVISGLQIWYLKSRSKKLVNGNQLKQRRVTGDQF